jgi:hypothetical protein
MKKNILWFFLVILLISCPSELAKNTTWTGTSEYTNTVTASIFSPGPYPQIGIIKADINSLILKEDKSATIELKITSSSNSFTGQSGTIINLDGTYTIDNDGNLICKFYHTINGVYDNIEMSGKLDFITYKGKGTSTGTTTGNSTGSITGTWNIVKK